jgi:hypothetical protein
VPAPHHIIGLGGHARSGKDTVAAYLIERYGFVRYAFADAVRTAALALDPIIYTIPSFYVNGAPEPVRLSEIVAADGWEDAKAMPEVRRTLQRFGMGVRDIDPAFWIKATMAQLADETRPVVVTDVRFPNEVEAVRARGGLFVRVRRPGATGNGHISEHANDHIAADVEINNAGSLADLAATIERTLAERINL